MRRFSVWMTGLFMALTASGIAQDAPATPAFPKPFDTEPASSGLPLSPEDAAKGFQVPPGFKVSVFAAEPDVRNPIAMTWDGRGRLWVAENYTYADRSKVYDFSLRDRVLIFEDKDNDGKFDERKVFTDDVQLLTSVEVGRSGVWLMTPPQLIFIPDKDRDDKPDSEPVVMLDGFTPSRDNYHTFANGIKWGPDGWLYGRCGASSPGRIGVPGATEAQRVPLNGGIWRFHPERKVFEVLCHGTTNPWGLDWDALGQAFFVNTVNGHLWQVIPGAHYKRPHSEDPNPYVYEMIDTHADHYHWDTGKDWTDSRNPVGEHDRLGGGHAHSGCLIYQGGSLPLASEDMNIHGLLLTLNLHGRRVNVDAIRTQGAANIGNHVGDILKSADPWFRGIDLTSGPDGSLFILDWSDTGECHDTTGVHRSSGRIFKVTYGPPPALPPFDLHQQSNQELVALHSRKNQNGQTNNWYTRQARQELITRKEAIHQNANEMAQLRSLPTGYDRSLEYFQTLHGLDLIDSASQKKGLVAKNAWHRAVAIHQLVDRSPLDTILGLPHPQAASPGESAIQALLQMAQSDSSGPVRLALASALQRIPVNRRLELARWLVQNGADANDHNLPLMVWYGIMPVAETDPRGLARFLVNCQFPMTRRLIARRLAEMIDKTPLAIESVLAELSQIESMEARDRILPDVLQGMDEAFVGRHKLKAPANWTAIESLAALSSNLVITERVSHLNLLFGDGRALDEVKRIVRDGKASLAHRKAALTTLIALKPDDLRAICEESLNVRSLNTIAVGGLTGIDDPALAQRLAKSYRSFYPAERPALIDALASRPSFANALLKELKDGKIPRTDLTPVHARQIRSFENSDLSKQLTEVWGELRDSPVEKLVLMQSLKQQLTPEVLAQADKSQGRVLYQKTCANCHRLYGYGETIGPDLTGAGRASLDYLLLNMVDPSATVGAEYRLSIVVLKDGRVLNGIVASRNDKTLTLQTAKERMTIELGEIEEVKPSTVSLMPDGQLQTLTAEQVRDLVGYLMHPVQAPLPAEFLNRGNN